MNKYKSNVGIYCHKLIEPRIEINSGCDCVAQSQFMDGQFNGGLYLPKKDWKEFKEPNLYSFDVIQNLNGNNIHIFEISEELLKEIYSQYIITCGLEKIELQTALVDKHLSKPITKKIINDISHMLSLTDDDVLKKTLYFAYFHLLKGASKAQKTSSTRDSRSEFKVRGLHVDNWQTPRKKIYERSTSGHKVIVNLGLENRHFTYVDITAESIYKMTDFDNFNSMRDLIIESNFASPIGEWFLSTYPNYPIKRILMKPGMGIITPVQNLIHDGDLFEKKLPDLVSMISLRK